MLLNYKAAICMIHLYRWEVFTGHWRRWQCYNTPLTGTERVSLSAHTGGDTAGGSTSQTPTGRVQQAAALESLCHRQKNGFVPKKKRLHRPEEAAFSSSSRGYLILDALFLFLSNGIDFNTNSACDLRPRRFSIPPRAVKYIYIRYK